MPIYEFICEDCHYQEDLMRKISEPTKILCPKCDNQNFVKQVQLQILSLKVLVGTRLILRIKIIQKKQKKIKIR